MKIKDIDDLIKIVEVISQINIPNYIISINSDEIIKTLEEVKLILPDVSGSFSHKDLLNGYCAGALETLTNKEDTFLGYDHLNKIKTEAEEWKERYTNAT